MACEKILPCMHMPQQLYHILHACTFLANIVCVYISIVNTFYYEIGETTQLCRSLGVKCLCIQPSMDGVESITSILHIELDTQAILDALSQVGKNTEMSQS